MKGQLDIDLLRAFLEVAESGSFTRAARRLHRVQSAVSMQIKRLEEAAGCRLFDREGRQVRLTHEGTVLLGYARRILSLSAEALSDLRDAGDTPLVRLGVSDVASYLLRGILSRFSVIYPWVQLEIVCDRSWHLLDALDAGDLHLALVTQHQDHGPGQLVREEPLVWAAAVGRAPHALNPVPLALFAEGCVYREAAIHALDRCGKPWRIAYSSVNSAGLDAAVGAGLAVATTVQSTLTDDRMVLGGEHGFPPLPNVRITLHRAPGDESPVASRLAREIMGESATL